jgi:ribosomal protein S18 acetylase RimI-like enzyme
VTSDVHLRRYDPRDGDAVRHLHRIALRDAGTDPADVPGTADLRRIGAIYLDGDGDFVVGVRRQSRDQATDGTRGGDGRTDAETGSGADETPLATYDGRLVSMGGFVPSEAGYADERTVPGAAELHRMRVAPADQRAGHGRRLLAELERRARAAGFDRATATTAARQAAAVSFYAAAGYAEVGRSRAGEYELVHFEKDL